MSRFELPRDISFNTEKVAVDLRLLARPPAAGASRALHRLEVFLEGDGTGRV